ncbi:MAG: hypothetical protein KBC73_10260 [Burkholderiaceae bacterium]|nr:hypothetical protein [Burkholderiaceae bacterium]
MHPAHLAPLALAAALSTLIAAPAAAAPGDSAADPIKLLFVGNSYTFGRVAPVLHYNAAHVHDLTQPQGPLRTDNLGAPFTNLTGTNSYPVGTIDPGTGQEFTSYSPHSQTQAWGGVPGIFKQFTDQAGLHYDVSLSTRNAASLRGQFLNTANSNWNLRGNIASQAWDKVVLQEQSDEPLPALTVGTAPNTSTLNSNYPSFQAYLDRVEDYVHQGAALSYRERAMYTEIYGSVAGCVAAGGTQSSCDNNTLRTVAANTNANAAAQIYLYQTWARPNLINAPGATSIDPRTGNASYSGAPAASFYGSLEAMTQDLVNAYAGAAAFAGADGSGGIAGIAPVGQAFLRAVTSGVATRDLYAADALSDGLIDLWFNDGTHASVAGSYLAALTLFGTITGVDPRSLGAGEIAAADLGLSSTEASALQAVAAAQLGFTAPVPEPGSWALMLGGLLLLPVLLPALRRRGRA